MGGMSAARISPAFIARAAVDAAALAILLEGKLARMGVDTTMPLALFALPDGRVGVLGFRPDKPRVEQIFAEDPGLSGRFRSVSANYDFAAAGRLAEGYAAAWDSAADDSARQSLRLRYQDLGARMEKLAGRMTLCDGALVAAASQYAGGGLLQ